MGRATSELLDLPEGNYAVEVRALQAVIVQQRNLLANLEAVLFSLRVYCHKVPILPEPKIKLEDGDIVEDHPGRLVRGSVAGICKGKDVENVSASTDGQEAATTGS